ncbi:hypothetical protein RB820 [Rhodopirellula baltica SH 1]|uniref:Uncharacterized protein n=1 Tax=Rhodopirellula baltica (strain DSM 10527 / NCIMB 13988 / SH1) TaxID=243090 RepID=Q7UY80_RHOBA|nr:hypothetical protein RB820 [Rhodopirellula baltica SH 1]
MRENRTYGSEGGESGSTGLPYPYTDPQSSQMDQIEGDSRGSIAYLHEAGGNPDGALNQFQRDTAQRRAPSLCALNLMLPAPCGTRVDCRSSFHHEET